MLLYSLRFALCGTALALAGCSAVAPHPEFLAAPAGEAVAKTVERESLRAQREGRALLVYVGATWCEPCQRFHAALKAGKLDTTFPNLRLIEYDNDRDAERLAVAGYRSRFIPLFAAPAPDGRSSGRQVEGSVKGDGAVQDLVPRLRALLAP